VPIAQVVGSGILSPDMFNYTSPGGLINQTCPIKSCRNDIAEILKVMINTVKPNAEDRFVVDINIRS
jgi:hypothetical protein